MKYYAYKPRADGSEPLGTFGRTMFEANSNQKAIKKAKKLLGVYLDIEFKLFTYTNFYDEKTFKEIKHST